MHLMPAFSDQDDRRFNNTECDQETSESKHRNSPVSSAISLPLQEEFVVVTPGATTPPAGADETGGTLTRPDAAPAAPVPESTLMPSAIAFSTWSFRVPTTRGMTTSPVTVPVAATDVEGSLKTPGAAES